MNKEELQAFLAQPHDAIIAINRPGKGAQLSVVWFLWYNESFYFTTLKKTAKYLNVQRDTNISFIVNDSAGHSYVTAYGQAIVHEAKDANPEIFGLLLEKYVPAEQRAQYLAGIGSQASDRVLVELHPEKVSGITPRY